MEQHNDFGWNRVRGWMNIFRSGLHFERIKTVYVCVYVCLVRKEATAGASKMRRDKRLS